MTKEPENRPLNPPTEISAENGGTSYSPNTKKSSTPFYKNKKVLGTLAVCLILLILLIVLIVVFLTSNDESKATDSNGSSPSKIIDGIHEKLENLVSDKHDNDGDEILHPPDVEEKQPPSAAVLRFYNKGAVCSDSDICSKIGKDIFLQGGSVVDAAIATMLCLGVTVMQSSGIGGGFLMNVFIRGKNKAYTLDAREYAPAAATENMFDEDPKLSIHGPLSIAVPGEIVGLLVAHERFGRLPWKDLVKPAILVCESGFLMSRHMSDALSFVPDMKNDKNLRNLFVNRTTGDYLREGEEIRPEKLCDTLAMLADHTGTRYTGEIGEMLEKDLKDLKSLITRDDLVNYQAHWYDSVPVKVNNDTMYVVPFPGSGLIIAFIMNILKGYNIQPSDIDTIEKETLLYHRVIEAFKFAYSYRSELGDPAFVNITNLANQLNDEKFAETIRLKIDDKMTHNDPNYYDAKHYSKTNHGTSPLTLIAPNGDAVAITTTINYYFGSLNTGGNSGIIFNDAMNDFSLPNRRNLYGFAEAPANYIQGRKRPLSSMSPTIITGPDGTVKLVLSAAGGSKIPTALAFALVRHLWLDENIKEVVDAARIHHQLSPMEIQYEFGILKEVVKGLKEKGHVTKRYRERGSVICAMYKNSSGVYANADYRKRGDVIGL